jgi:uncharacterized membrane protein YhaH (DUF805 family)
VTFQEAVTTVFTQKYTDFSGRARRSEYWFASLAMFLGYIVAAIIGFALHATFLIFILVLAIIVPGLAVSVRRLHDTGRSGWWYLINIIPFGGLVLLYWFVSDSEPGTNQYGPSPKEAPGYGDYGQAPNAGWGQA